MNLGRAIKTLRRQKAMNQMELADAIGITQTSLSLIETNAKRPREETLRLICKKLKINLIHLYIMAADESDIPKDKKKRELFNMLFPIIEKMIKQIWA